jgi:hypothetical protein
MNDISQPGTLWIANIQMQECQYRNGAFYWFRYWFAEQPSPRVIRRWIQLGVFIHFVELHSSGHLANKIHGVFLDGSSRYNKICQN